MYTCVCSRAHADKTRPRLNNCPESADRSYVSSRGRRLGGNAALETSTWNWCVRGRRPWGRGPRSRRAVPGCQALLWTASSSGVPGRSAQRGRQAATGGLQPKPEAGVRRGQATRGRQPSRRIPIHLVSLDGASASSETPARSRQLDSCWGSQRLLWAISPRHLSADPGELGDFHFSARVTTTRVASTPTVSPTGRAFPRTRGGQLTGRRERSGLGYLRDQSAMMGG